MSLLEGIGLARPNVWWAALAVGVLHLMCSCSKQGREQHEATGSDSSLTVVRLALNWLPEPEFGGFYEARERGIFARHSLDARIEAGGAGVPVLQRVATGQIEFAITGADELVMARSRGADLVALFATFQTSPQGIMVHASRNLRNLEEVFASGTVAIEPGLPYAAFLRRKFGNFGATLVPYDGGVARFLTDKNLAQQCYVTSEPIAAARSGAEVRVFLIADAGYNPYGAVVVGRRVWLEQHVERARAFVAASAEGWRSYLDDPRPTNELLRRLNASLSPPALAAMSEAQEKLIETEETSRRGLGTMTRERWAQLVDQLVEVGAIDRAVAPDGLFLDPSYTAMP